tara:strand:+ start:282 stop:626 length:345 start_codon:yes stop_codon:yes gene_type:complete
MTQLKVFSLEGCYFSQSAEELLKNNNIDYSLKKVTQNEKQAIKDINKMDTFPQVFLETSNKDIKVGGFTELKNLNELVNKKDNFDNIYDEVSNKVEFNNNKKNILRLINILRKE